MIRVLIACEFSGIVREAFNARAGFEAVSCDLLPAADGRSDRHYQGDVFDIIRDGWDLMIAHPPCTYLASSGLHWNSRIPGRDQKTREALDFVCRLMRAPVRYIAIENPPGRIGTAIRKADQYIHPHQFGHDASKTTGLWLKNLPRLIPTKNVPPRIVDGRPRWPISGPATSSASAPYSTSSSFNR